MGSQRNRSVRTPLDDTAIIALYWERNEKAIEETDIKYKKYLLSVAYNILHDTMDCEECLNDTYIGAWNAIPPSRPGHLRAFLTTILRRISINRYHANAKKSTVPSEMTVALSEIEAFTGDGSSVQEAFDAHRLGGIISQYLRSLTPRRRYIFMSRYYVADTVDRIAKDLRVSRSTVNKELASIRADLKERLEREGYPI